MGSTLKIRFVPLIIALFLLLIQSPRLLGVVLLNGAAHELMLAVSDAPALFPYAFGEGNLAHARRAEQIATQGRSFGATSARLDCLRFRAQVALMDWQAAWATLRVSPCDDDVSLYVHRAPWEAIRVVEHLQRGEEDAARVQFHRALAEGSGLFAPSFESLFKPLSNQNTIFVLQKDAPRFLVGTKINYEWRPVLQPVSPSWALVGYDVDESALETGERVTIALFWQPLRSDAVPDKDWTRVGTLWRQEARLINLIPDAGFEWVSEGVSAWRLPPNVARVIWTTRHKQTTRALEILPNPGGGGTIASTPVLPLGAYCMYLMGGWVRSQGAAPVFSILWDGLRNDPDDPPFVNLMEGPRDLEWMHVSTIVAPKRGARGVRVFASNWAALWLQSLRAPYAMAVDNVFLIPISVPNLPRCVFYER